MRWPGQSVQRSCADECSLLPRESDFHHGLPGRSMSANACFATDETSLCRVGCFPGRDSPRFNGLPSAVEH